MEAMRRKFHPCSRKHGNGAICSRPPGCKFIPPVSTSPPTHQNGPSRRLRRPCGGGRSGFQLQHIQALLVEVDAHLYAGRPVQAWTTINESWPALKSSLLLRVQQLRVGMTFSRARSAVAAAYASPAVAAQDELVRSAVRDACQLERERMPYVDPAARLIRAAIALHRGKHAEAVALLEAAAVELEAMDVLLLAAAARWRLGTLVGGERGQAFIQKAKAFMTGQEIRNPARLLQVYAPGFPVAE